MIFAFTLALIAIASGFAATYLYAPRRASFTWRLCAGTVTGFVLLGLIGFAVASAIGFGATALLITTALIAAPLLLLIDEKRRAAVRSDVRAASREVRESLIRPSRGQIVCALFYASIAVLWWYIFDGAMAQDTSGIHTDFDNNFGDLPFHIGIITGFVYGENFPPQHPEFAGVKLTYPFVVDFIASIFMRAGASLRGALFFQNFLLAMATVGLIHRWAVQLTRDRAASLLTIALIFLSGGFGWVMFFGEVFTTPQGLFEFLARLPHNYSITPNLYRWGNSITTLFVPQRSMLLGVPLFLIITTLWWQAIGDKDEDAATEVQNVPQTRDEAKRKQGKKEKRHKRAHIQNKSHIALQEASAAIQLPEISAQRRMIAAGIIAGLLPLAHAHTFGVVLMTGGALALIFREWRLWIAFFIAAMAVAAPQLLWATQGSETEAGNFIAREFGWHNERNNVLWFWFINTGLFIPALVAALYFRRLVPVTRRAILFYLPFTLCFIVPNVVRLSPWIWDNIKVLFYWYIASTPFVALLIMSLWRRRKWYRAAAFVLALSLMLAGGLDVWRALSGTARNTLFDDEAVQFAEIIRRRTPPEARILNAPIHNSPTLLAGRSSFFGYPGHLWTHGLPYTARETDVRNIYAGAPDAANLLRQYQIGYVVVGADERGSLPFVNEEFFATRFPIVGEIGGYRLYQITN